jgi:hypothetical protein
MLPPGFAVVCRQFRRESRVFLQRAGIEKWWPLVKAANIKVE